MLRDVFYYGKKPNIHPREKPVNNLQDARAQSTTEHFWIINEFCDYKNFDWDFDFEFLPDEDVWAENHNNVWPSQHQKDSGTWLCPKEHSDIIIYRNDVDVVKRKNVKSECWVILDKIDETKFDFSWHPDPTDPPFIYKWGCKYYPAQIKHVLEYCVPGAIQEKYMSDIVELLPNWNLIVENDKVDYDKFDMSWRPNPLDPPYIYIWGNRHVDGTLRSTLEYHVPGATEKKYMPEKLEVLPQSDRWVEHIAINKDSFDLSWRPDPREPAYNYLWGNKYEPAEIKPTLEYRMPGATEKKYMEAVVEVLPQWERWNLIENVDKSKFDFTWRPDSREPAYVYVWGNKYEPAEIKPTLEYRVPGATQYKFMSEAVDVLPEYEKWKIYQQIDESKFDLSWRPDPREPAYIYVWGNRWVPGEITPTLEYHTPGATEIKYMGNVEILPDFRHWNIIQKVDKTKFDFTWMPDPREPAYIYVWGNKWVAGELSPSLEYYTPGATEKKYMDNSVPLLPDWGKWGIHDTVEFASFDFTWMPDPREPAYIYVWGNKWVPGEIKPTIEYYTTGATEKKYMGDTAPVRPEFDKWNIIQNVTTEFDFTWRPDPREPAYIYTWGNKYIPAEIKPTVEYVCLGATERKYMGDVNVLPDFDKWNIVQKINETEFDLSWRPDPREPAYIYVWGNKYIPGEIKSTIEYYCEGATEKKYMHNLVEVIPEQNWKIYKSVDESKFDLSWRPDPREPAYIYVWGNKWVAGELAPSLEYHTPGATEKKYMGVVDTLPDYTKYSITHEPVDFDFTWEPDPREPAYIYVWGNKYIPGEVEATITYKVQGATEKKYMGNDLTVKPEYHKWKIYQQIDETKFDLSWRPDPREPAYIYVWGNKYNPGEIKSTLEYHAPGATEKKYMGNVEVLPELSKWTEIQQIDRTKFDLSWRPDPREPAYIYVWGNKWIRGELKSTIEYHCEGATEYKYMQDVVEVLPEFSKWKETQKVNNFDFTWRPDPREPAYIYTWGNKWINAELKPTLEYYCEGATERKYMGNVDVLPEYEKYNILIPIDKETFDFTWRPDPREPAYIYVWGNQSNSAEVEPTVEYHCEGATERKYMSDRVAKTLPSMENWKTLIPVDSFDFTWRPDPGSPPYIYVFGNQWHDAMTEPTIEYHVDGAKDRKYITDIVATVSKTQANWKTLIPVDSFDYSWRPNPHSQPYIYVFGNQWHDATREPTVEYHQPGATEYSYITDIKAIVKSTSTENHWKTLLPIDSFDFSWRPDPKSPPYIYVFGNKWNSANIEPTVEYHVEGATDKKYIESPVAIPTAQLNLWSVSNSDDLETFDFTWRPNPHSPPQIYQWSDNGPRYTIPGATEIVYMVRSEVESKVIVEKYFIKTTLEDLINEHPNEVFWALNSELKYDTFNFSWRPDQSNFMHVNVFGTHTYYVNAPLYLLGHKQFNYIDQNIKIETQLSMFFIDKSNKHSNEHFEKIKLRYPEIQKTRYLNSWVETIARCVNKSKTKFIWILSSELDYTDFEFDFYPSTWQEKMIHVFGTQWSHWGNTYLINKDTFIEDTKYVKIIEHLSNLNFVKTKRAKAVDNLYSTVCINFGNLEDDQLLELKDKNIEVVNYDESYFKTFKNILNQLPDKKENFLWVITSVCDYTNFDFTYICDPFAKDQLHVFPSNLQKYGDTFFVNVNKLKELVHSMNCLQDYEKINFNQTLRVDRLDPPRKIVNKDTLTEIDLLDYQYPYVEVVVADNATIKSAHTEPMCLWSENEKSIIINSTGGTNITIPTDYKNSVKNELYDYPNIKKSNSLAISKPLDIVFLSNGEKNSDENYEHLLKATKNLKNRVIRIDGINGRVQAYHAAANASTTPWMFTVFAKLKVNENFDWNWQPDRLQAPKHYIFNATNPVNKLEYGHQAMIAYNKKLALANQGNGLDFTLDDNHEVLEINSGVANFNTDAYSTWRTSFREVIKLCNDPDYMSQMRLHTWLTKAEGDFAEYALNGANDAYSYYEENKEDFSKLKLSYEWKWLHEYFTNKYKS